MRYIHVLILLILLAGMISGCVNSSSVNAATLSIPPAATDIPEAPNVVTSTPAASLLPSPASITSTPAPVSTSIPSATISLAPEWNDDEWIARQNPVMGLVWSPDGRILAVNAISGFYRFDIARNKIIYALAESDGLVPFAIDPQGQYLFVKNRVWDVLADQLLYQLPVPNLIADAAFSPDLKTLAVSDNNRVTLWDISTGKLQETLNASFGDGQQGLAYSPDGNLLYAVSGDRSVKRIDLISGQYTELFALPEDGCCVVFSADRALMLVNRPHHGEGSKQLWDVAQGMLITDSGRCDSDVSLTAFSPDSQYFVIGPCGLDAQLWRTSPPQQIHSFPSVSSSNFYPEWRSAAFSPDGTQLALGNDMGEVLIWDITSQQLVNTLSIPLAPLPDP